MPLARALIGHAARAGGADWPARKSAFDSATSRYPQYPAEPRTRKYFVGRVRTFGAPSYADRVRTDFTVLSFSLLLPFRLPTYRSLHFPNIFDVKNTKNYASSSARYSRSLRLASSRAREKTARHLSELFPRGCHARVPHSFLPSSRFIGVQRFTCCGCVLCERALCVPWILVLFSDLLLIFTDFSTACPQKSTSGHCADNFIGESYIFSFSSFFLYDYLWFFFYKFTSVYDHEIEDWGLMK